MRAKRVRLIGGVKERHAVALLTPAKNERSYNFGKKIIQKSLNVHNYVILNIFNSIKSKTINLMICYSFVQTLVFSIKIYISAFDKEMNYFIF